MSASSSAQKYLAASSAISTDRQQVQNQLAEVSRSLHALPVRAARTLSAPSGQRMYRTSRGVWLAVPLLLGLSACSFAVVRPTPKVDPATAYRTCGETGYFVPVLDAWGAGAAAATAFILPIANLGAALCEPQPRRTCPQHEWTPPASVAWVAAAALAASSAYGFAARSHCHQMLEDAARATSELRLDEALREKRPVESRASTASIEPPSVPAPAR